MADPRLQALNNFTQTKHSSPIPSNLSLPSHRLPEGFTVLLLGASEGIGEHIAYAYACALTTGTIILSARGLQNLRRVRSKIEDLGPFVRVEVCTCDIASSESVSDLHDFITDNVGRLDCVIVNAAYAPPITLKTHLDQPPDLQRAFDVNCMGTYNAAHYFLPLLLKSPNGARQFIAIGSMAGSIRRGHIANMGYCVSKMAQTRMIEYLHEQYGAPGDGGLWTVTVHPGAVMTSMAKGNTPDSFLPYLIDDIGLCGAVCVYLSKRVAAGELHWLGGRFVSANWDMDELLAKEEEIVERDMLKFAVMVE